jgi:D-alanine-D-alanine ligase
MKRVGVLCGGWGEEREISVKTGEAISAALESKGHSVTRIIAGPGLDQTLRATQVDVAFIALHGRMGEDGRVQGLLEVLGIPYTGSGVMASALAMNKPVAKKLFRQHNLATPLGYRVTRAQLAAADPLERHADLGFPCVVKPALGGSSVGLSVVRTGDALVPALEKACQYGGEALVERFVKGREVTVGLLGGEVLGALEVAHGQDTFDYAKKYQTGAHYHLPPRLSPTRVRNVEEMALAAYRALGCRGYARVDFLCSDSANDTVLELNTLPGMTPMSLLPKIARHRGIAFEDLVERILSLATLDEVDVEPAAPALARPAAARSAG